MASWAAMNQPPFDVTMELDGWDLLWARLERRVGHEPELAALRERVVAEVRERLVLKELSSHPTVAGLRRLFKAAGCDPTRYRPSSEALLRRLLKGSEMPEISPLVDLNNCLSAALAVPCCVSVEESLEPPFVVRAGREGESYASLRGPFNLEGKPLLVDQKGPVDTPITGSQRVKVEADTERVWLTAYLPHGVVDPEDAAAKLEELAAAAPVAEIELLAASVGTEAET